jgi:hypothetical protein
MINEIFLDVGICSSKTLNQALSLQILTLHGYGFVENNQNCDIIT